MQMRCSHCGWEGDSDERVPATPEWVQENGVDAAHFLENNLNCPDCGESSAWIVSDGDSDYDFEEE